MWACARSTSHSGRRGWRRHSTNCSVQLLLSVLDGPRPNLQIAAYWAAVNAPTAGSGWLPASTATTLAVATSTPVVTQSSTATLSLWLVAENTGAAPASATELRYYIAPTGGKQRHRRRHGRHGNVASQSEHTALLTAAQLRRRWRLDCGVAELELQVAGSRSIARRDCLLPAGLLVGSYGVWVCLQAVPWEQQRADNCATALPLQVVAASTTATTTTPSTGTTTITPPVGTGHTGASSATAQLSLDLAWRTEGSATTVGWQLLAATQAQSSTATLSWVADSAAQSLPLSVVLTNTGSAAALTTNIQYYLSGIFWQLQRHSGPRHKRFGRFRSRHSDQPSIEAYRWVRRNVALDCGAAPVPSVGAGQSLLGHLDCTLPAGTASDAIYRLWACTATGTAKSRRLRNCSSFLSLTRSPAAASALQLSLSGPTLLSEPALSVQLSVANPAAVAATTATLSYYLADAFRGWRVLDCGIGAATVAPLAAGVTRSWQQDCALPSLPRGNYQLQVCLDPDTTVASAPQHNCQSLALRVNVALLATGQQADTGEDDLVGTLGTDTDTAPPVDGSDGTALPTPSATKPPPPPANLARHLRVVATTQPQAFQLPVLLHGDAPQYPVELPFVFSASSNAPSGAASHTVLPSSRVISISSGRRGEILLQLPANYASSDGNPVRLTFSFTTTGVRNAVVGHADSLRVTIHPAETNLPPTLLHLPRDGVVGLQLRQPADATTPMRVVEQSATPVELRVQARDPNGDAISGQWWLFGPLPSRSILFSAISTGTVSNNIWLATFSFNPQALELGQRYLNQVRLDDGRGGVTTVRRRFHVVAEGSTATHHHDSDGNGIGDAQQRHHLHHLLQGTVSGSTPHVLMAESGLSISLGEYSERAYQRRAGQPAAALPSDDELLSSVGTAGYTLHDISGVYDFELRGVEREESGVGGEAMVVLPQQLPIPAGAVYLKYSAGRWQPFDTAAGALHSAALAADGACPSPDDDSAYQPGLTVGHHCVRLTLMDGSSNDADGEVNGTVIDPGGIAVSAAPAPLTPTPSSGGGGGGGATSLLTVLGLLLLLVLSRQPALRAAPSQYFRSS